MNKISVPLSTVKKPKELPEIFHAAFEHVPGALPEVAFRGGKFYRLTYTRARPTHFFEEKAVEAGPDAVIVCDLNSFGVTILN